MNNDHHALLELLNQEVERFNHPNFIPDDPISIPHRFRRKEDIEISAFLVATIAWGNRKSILANANQLMELMLNAPYEFVMDHCRNDLMLLEQFTHRTFQGIDLQTFIAGLRNIYLRHGGPEAIFTRYQTADSLQPAISEFKKLFFTIPHSPRTQKHISDPAKGSAAKRINLFLRWMIRNDDKGVDFGLWKQISPSKLSCPLDIHSGRVARELGLLTRKQNDAKAVQELDRVLRQFDPNDPVKYDFALFGLGTTKAI